MFVLEGKNDMRVCLAGFDLDLRADDDRRGLSDGTGRSNMDIILAVDVEATDIFAVSAMNAVSSPAKHDGIKIQISAHRGVFDLDIQVFSASPGTDSSSTSSMCSLSPASDDVEL